MKKLILLTVLLIIASVSLPYFLFQIETQAVQPLDMGRQISWQLFDLEKKIDDIAYHVCMTEKERYYEACPESQHECAWTGCPLHPDFN